jgi:hypothetical protein
MYISTLLTLILPAFLFLTAQQGCSHQTADLAKGTWGGQGIGLTVEENHAVLQFDCASGEVNSQIKVAKDGSFDVAGTLSTRSPGPTRVGPESNAKNVRYKGKVDGKSMTLAIVDQDGKTLSSHTLELGAGARIHRCY